MGVYTGSVRVVDSVNGVSGNALMELYNEVTDAFLTSGMIKIPDGEIAGQAGEFVMDGRGAKQCP